MKLRKGLAFACYDVCPPGGGLFHCLSSNQLKGWGSCLKG